MKKAKTFVALLVAVAAILGISSFTLAAAPTSGSVTVNPNYKSETYTLYKLFDAKMDYKDDGTLQAVTYQLPSGKTAADLIYIDGEGTAHQWFKLNDNGNVEANTGVTTDWAKDANAIKWAKSFGSAVGSPIQAASNNDANVKWTGLAWGYYFVSTTTGSFIGIDTDNPDVTIQDKNSPPDLDKSITGVKDSTGADSGSVFTATETSETTDTGAGTNEQAIAQIGDTVSYKLTVTIHPGGENYVIKDTLTNLKIIASSFKVGGEAVASNSKVDASGTTITDKSSEFTIKLAQSYLDTITAETKLVITYDAVLDKDAAVADEANPNTAVLTYGTSPNKSEDKAKVWTAKVNVEKKIDSETGDPLAGAGFKLKNSAGKFYKFDAAAGVTWVAEDQADEFFTGDDGSLPGNGFYGLANGTYTLVETTVPDGYNKMEDTTVTISDANAAEANLAQTKKVINKKGSLLPSTGGIGTTIFYIIGAILVIGAGILLVTRRRMR